MSGPKAKIALRDLDPHLPSQEDVLWEDREIETDTHKNTPIITIPRHVVDEHSGGGDRLDVVTIDVMSGAGQKTRFFVDVHLKNSRVVLTVATNKGDETVSKKLVGEWRDDLTAGLVR